MTTPTYKGHAKDCAILAKGGELQCNCGMTTPTPRYCEHGQLARSCEICELKRELAAAIRRGE